MANYANLKAAVNAAITTNGNNEITGAILNDILNSIISTIGGNYTFAGVVTPSTTISAPDANVFWIGGAGTYAQFGGTITISDGNIGIFTYNGSYTRNEIAIAPNILKKGIEVIGGYYIGSSNNLPTINVTGSSVYGITSYLRIDGISGTIPIRPFGASPYPFAGIYDENFVPLGCLYATGSVPYIYDTTSLGSDVASFTGAKYVRFTANRGVAVNDIISSISPVSQAAYNEDLIPLLSAKNLNGIYVEQFKLVKERDGLPYIDSTTINSYGITGYLRINNISGTIPIRPFGASPYPFAGIYDENFVPLGCLYKSSSAATTYDTQSLASDVSSINGAYYVRFNVNYSSAVDGKVSNIPREQTYMLNYPSNTWWDNIAMFDYAKVLSMPKDVVKGMIEIASNGQCTAIYDADGYPSIMRKIPIISVGALAPELGELTDVHPAFIVDGVQKAYIYLSVYQTCSYNGHYVSWFGLQPVGGVTITTLRSTISSKGSGWHLETVYERSLLSLLAAKCNSPLIRGNSAYGRCADAGYEYETCQMNSNRLPGYTGGNWIQGTEPETWSHTGKMWGIQNVVGCKHEICDLIKIIDGYIYIASDNAYNGSESDWINTGVAVDYINRTNRFGTAVTATGATYITSQYEQTLCKDEYDTLPIGMRKKMVMLGIVPRLSSTESSTVLGYRGNIQVKNSGTCYGCFGGAADYPRSGLGYYNLGYDLTTVAHGNMGSRLAYIE